MAEPAKTPVVPAVNNTNLTVRIHGKIDRIERYDTENGAIFTTLIIVPAPDTMSSPTRLQVKSTSKFGNAEEMVDIKTEIRSRYWKQKSGKVAYTPELWWNE